MNKITKLLSLFMIAGAIGTGVAGVSACKKHDHTKDTQWVVNQDDETKHHQECKKDQTVIEGTEEGHNWNDENKCDKCGVDKPAPKPVVVEIATAADFVKFREATGDVTTEDGVTTAVVPAGTYKLTADIDLEGVTLGATAAILGEGVIFDGQGHTIKNATYTGGPVKTGILCASLEGGEVKNVKFMNCSSTVAGETTGIIAGICNGGKISQVEFNGCSAVASGTYVGILFGRNMAKATIEISEITTKNGCFTSCSQYGGFVMGDMVSGTKVSMTNMDIAGELKASSGNGSFIFGRVRAGEVSLENSVIRSATIATETKNGLITGGTKADKLTIKNVLVVDANGGFIAKEGKEANIPTGEALVVEKYVSVAGLATTIQNATATDGANTVAYLKDTLGLDFTNVWMEEGEGGYRLKAASSNVRGAGTTVKSVKVSAANAKVRFKKGEDFSTGEISVVATFSDETQMPLALDAEQGYEIDSSAFNKDAKGAYEIVIKSKEDPTKTDKYTVNVVEETGFNVYDEHMAHTIVKGGKVDNGKLVVKSVWSDDVEEKISESATGYSLSAVDTTTAGKKTLTITYGSYTAKTVELNVIDTKPVPVDGKLYVNVDAASTLEYSGKKDDKGIETFKSVHDAIKFLEACNFDKSVEKVVRIAPGTYTGKIDTNLSNLTLVGLGTTADDVKITYSAVEDTIDLLTGQPYVMKCATVYVVGDGFQAHNLSIRNDFDYINEASKHGSPQGIALTVEGDQTIINNCHIYGNQDTVYMRKGRAWFKNTQIDGNIDFICGEANAILYFDECTIKAINKFADSVTNKSNNGYVIAMKGDSPKVAKCGVVFNKCAFTADEKVQDGAMSLARTWGKNPSVAFVDCSYTKAYSKEAYGAKDNNNKALKARWEAMSNASPANATFVEVGGTGEGAISKSVIGGKWYAKSDAEVAKYAMTEIFKRDNYPATTATVGDVETTTYEFAEDWAPVLTSVTDLTTLVDTATGLYVSSETVKVTETETADLHIGLAPWNLSDKTAAITVTSSNAEVATWADGKVTGVSEGTATLTVACEGHTSKTVTVTVEAVESVKKTYTFDKSRMDSLVTESTVGAGQYLKELKDGKKLDQATFNSGIVVPGEGNDFLKIVDTGVVTFRTTTSTKTQNFIENKDAGLELEFKGKGTLTIKFASTGGNNKSRLGLLNAAGEMMEATSATAAEGGQVVKITATSEAPSKGEGTVNESGSYECGNGAGSGTKEITMVYTITKAGKYKITCPSAVVGRGARIISVVMEDNEPVVAPEA